jgi:hypothetical protein
MLDKQRETLSPPLVMCVRRRFNMHGGDAKYFRFRVQLRRHQASPSLASQLSEPRLPLSLHLLYEGGGAVDNQVRRWITAAVCVSCALCDAPLLCLGAPCRAGPSLCPRAGRGGPSGSGLRRRGFLPH